MNTQQTRSQLEYQFAATCERERKKWYVAPDPESQPGELEAVAASLFWLVLIGLLFLFCMFASLVTKAWRKSC